MKKYLMFGLAALAFASCSRNDFTPATQAEIDKAKYDQKFVETFGQPASNQDWGFGSSTRAFTRASINVNGNQWESCPAVGSTEDADVAAYVRALTTLPNTNPAQLQNYYVTQIHKGTETYTDLDNHSGILGSDKMNNLHIAMQSTATLNKSTGELSGDWVHINNFNAGNCTDWSAGVDGHGNTLVTGGGTFDFAYQGAEDSKYHNRWIAIDGANVPKAGGGNYAGNYYVCFDFEATNETVKTAWRAKFWNPEGNNGGEWQEKDFVIDGAYTLAQLEELEYTVELWSVIDNTNKPYTYRLGDTSKVTDLRIDNYREGNKVVLGNDKYDDWIIRLVQAQPKNQITYDLRVMAEDLTVNSASDFDFNDVVFDAKIDATAGKTYIKLLAAGGTMPLRIGCDASGNGGEEVHEKFGVTTSTMVNTAAGQHNAKTPVEFTLNQTWSSIGNIPVYVYKNGEWQPITAYTGMPASKFGCPVGTDWADERQDIDTKWDGNFTIWVGDTSKPFWANWNKTN